MIAVANRICLSYAETPERAVLDHIDMQIGSEDFISIQGPSGSGKSTLLYILGCLLQPTKGELRIVDREISGLNDRELADLRNRQIGFIFQGSNLAPSLTVVENIMAPLFFRRGLSNSERPDLLKDIAHLINEFGLEDKTTKLPHQLSIGERRRVAIIRATVNRPALILADEPTAGLDPERALHVTGLLRSLVGKDRAIVMVTHDPAVAAKAFRQYDLINGKLEPKE